MSGLNLEDIKTYYIGLIYTEQTDEYRKRLKEFYGITDINITPDRTLSHISQVDVPIEHMVSFNSLKEVQVFTKGFFYGYTY